MTPRKAFRYAPWALASLATAFAQNYRGPVPPKPDLIYIKHADTLLATEAVEAKEEKKKDDSLYIIEGAKSTSRTPLALPIFYMKMDKINPDTLTLYRLATVDGRREVLLSVKKQSAPIHVVVTKVSPDGIYKLDVYDTLDAGEYALSSSNSNKAFCFAVD